MSANKTGSHFENFWGCLQVFFFFCLAGMVIFRLASALLEFDPDWFSFCNTLKACGMAVDLVTSSRLLSLLLCKPGSH